MPVFPPLAATGIGSVPFTEPEAAAALILKYLPELPFWPQLVRRGYSEDMVPQGARGLPGLLADPEARLVRLNPQVPRELALAEFYEVLWQDNLEPFSLIPEEAAGFFALCRAAAQASPTPAGLKGQVVGPVTFAGMVKDDQDKPILYDHELTQAVSLGLAKKAAWQAEQFRRLGVEALIFFDEPILTGFGSAFFPVSREEVTVMLTETLEAARQSGPVLLGLHCCGNTDWSLVLSLPLDVVSFDAYGYFDSLTLYEEPLRRFLARGGWLAWGLVPTGEELSRETADSLWERFTGQVTRLAALGLTPTQVLAQSLLTPSCGLGYLAPEAATSALALLQSLSIQARDWLASC
jgi:hypothetical protein